MQCRVFIGRDIALSGQALAERVSIRAIKRSATSQKKKNSKIPVISVVRVRNSIRTLGRRQSTRMLVLQFLN